MFYQFFIRCVEWRLLLHSHIICSLMIEFVLSIRFASNFSSMRFFIFDEFCSLRIQHVKKSWKCTYKFFIHDEFDSRRYLSIFFIFCMSFVVRRCFLIKIVNADINFDIFIHFAKSLIKHYCRDFLIEFQNSFVLCLSSYIFNSNKSK